MERAEFENRIRQNWPMLRGIARRFDPGPEIDDICQEAILVAWRKRACLKDIEAFGAWLRGIALNVGRAHLRRKQSILGPLRESDCPAPDHAQDVVDAQALAAALANLSERERETLEAKHLKGLSLMEISLLLQEPIGTTKSRLSRTRSKLREALHCAGWTIFGPYREKESKK